MKLLFVIVLITSFSVQATTWDKYLSGLPKDAQEALSKKLKCNSFGGDQLSPSDQKKWEKLGCDKNEKEVEALTKKYSMHEKFNRAIDCVEGTARANGCPENK